MIEESDITTDIEGLKKNLGCLIATASIPVTAFAGMGIGIGAGYVIGNVIDYIPLLKEAAPVIAQYTGLIKETNIPNLNEDLFQTAFGITGFLFGLRIPFYFREGWRKAEKAASNDPSVQEAYRLGCEHRKELEELEIIL